MKIFIIALKIQDFLPFNMFKILSFSLLVLFLIGCSSSFDTSNMAPEDRLNYAIKLYQQRDYQEAADEFQALILQYPGSSIVDDAQYYLGMSRFQRREYILAAFDFSRLIRNMSASEFLPLAQFMLAECYYQLSPNVNLDQTYSKKAIEEYQAFIDFFPLHEKVFEAETKMKELHNKLAQKEFNTARIYEKLEYFTASIKYYDNVMEVFHDTQFAPLALFNKIQILERRKQNDKALEEALKFIDKYPDHPNFRDVQNFKNGLEKKISASK